MQKISRFPFCSGGQPSPAQHCRSEQATMKMSRTPDLSFRGAKRRGNLGEAVAISPMAFPRSGRVLRDCHVGLRPPRNDKYGGQQRFIDSLRIVSLSPGGDSPAPTINVCGRRWLVRPASAFPRLHPKGTSSRFALRAPRARSALAMTEPMAFRKRKKSGAAICSPGDFLRFFDQALPAQPRTSLSLCSTRALMLARAGLRYWRGSK